MNATRGAEVHSRERGCKRGKVFLGGDGVSGRVCVFGLDARKAPCLCPICGIFGHPYRAAADGVPCLRDIWTTQPEMVEGGLWVRVEDALTPNHD